MGGQRLEDGPGLGQETVRQLTVDGLTYSFRLLRGAGEARTEPVVVLGGALQGMFGWPQMEDHVTAVADLVTADLPGMGDAMPLRPGQSGEVMVAATARIIDALGVPRVNLFGYSYGSAIAFGVAQRCPGRIARLVLGGVPAGITQEQLTHWERAAGRLAAGSPGDFATMAAEGLLCMDTQRPVLRRELVYRYVRRSLLHAAQRTPHAVEALDRALYSQLPLDGGLSGVPALVFAGEHDTVSSPERQRAFAATIEGSSFVTLPDSDHWVVLERADEVAELAVRFFTSPAPGTVWPTPRRPVQLSH